LDQHFTLCRFKGRCEKVFAGCEEVNPKLIEVNQEQAVRCLWYDNSITQKLPKMLNIKVINESSSASSSIVDLHEDESNEKIILNVENLKVYFPIQKGIFKRTVGYVKAVDDVSFHLPEGKTLALVGESGCGKTTVGRAI
ncbi:MAG TPA: ATP-binding cassette domain-containing protein, partial [Candidatus Berkiella sp.]|nr:ATP-binding cassette domain-containing protein [Candidatus Berkiella sp.]